MSAREFQLDEDSAKKRRGDRRNVSTTELSLFLGVLFQAGVLIWGAAKLSAAVENLAVTARDIKQEQREQGAALHGMRIDLTALKVKVDAR